MFIQADNQVEICRLSAGNADGPLARWHCLEHMITISLGTYDYDLAQG